MPRRGETAPQEEVHVFTVSELNRTVRDVLEGALGTIWIEGELSNIARPASGHVYFSLKDADAQVRCAMFRSRNRLLDFEPEAGMLVRARGRVSLYEARGDFQLVVEHLEPSGAGALARAFEELKRRLAAEGLFDAAHKRPLPRMPGRIGIVTSASGAAVRDVLQVLARRFAGIPAVVYPVPVQGERAAPEIARMLGVAGTRAECDVLLLVRGGGSLEDLWPFNEEVVARAIRACPIPVVSGVGHEVDVTIADFAADQRAPTPSAAAEQVTPDAATLRRGVDALARRLLAAGRATLRRGGERQRTLARRLRHQHPERRLQQLQQRRDELALRLQRAADRCLLQQAQRLASVRARLHHAAPGARIARLRDRLDADRRRLHAAAVADLRARRARVDTLGRALDVVSPLRTLGRGYALVRHGDDGRPVTRADAVAAGDPLAIRLAHGHIGARVESSRSDEPE